MLLNKIELKGFLSYYGQENETGELEPVIIDFRQSPLWLIHGKNGTGKTSLFDAISFALYGQHRGSGAKNNQAKYLVHHQADKAEINLEIEIEGQAYLIQRTITRTRRKVKGEYKEGSKLWGIVRHGSDMNSTAIPDTENNVAEWVEQHLKMSYETFVSSVLLRQGEADAFLKTKPTERRERLLEVLDLEFYKKLGERANKKSNDYKKEQSRIQQELDRLDKATEEEIKAKEKIIEENKKLLSQTKEKEKNKLQEKKNALDAKNYQQQIVEKQQQQKVYQALIDKQESIIQNVREYREIKNALQQLDILWEKRDRLSEEVTAIQQTEANINSLQVNIDRLDRDLKLAKQQETQKTDELTQSNRQLEQLNKRRNEILYQLKDLEQVKRLEKQIREAEKQLKPHLEILEISQQVQADFKRHQKLNTVVPLLQKLCTAKQQLTTTKAERKKSKIAVDIYEQKLETVRNKKNELNIQKDSLSKEAERTKKDLQHCQNKISNLQENLEHRESVSHAQECPTCGSHLDNPEVQKKLEQECQTWKEQITNLKQQEEKFNAQLEFLIKSKSLIEDYQKKANEQNNQLNTELTKATVNLENWQNTLIEHQQSVNSVREEARDWVEHCDRLSNLELELQSLNTIPEQKQKLNNAKLIENTIKPNLNSYYTELEKLPKFYTEEREQLSSEQNDITQLISDHQKKQENLEYESEQAKSVCQELDNCNRTKKNAIDSDRNRLKDLRKRTKKIKEEITNYKNSFSSRWKEHPACENKENLGQLRQQLNNLSNAETKEQELREAQKHFSKIAGEIDTLQAWLEKIPVEHCRCIDNIENELKQIKLELDRIDKQIQLENTTLVQIQSQKQQYEAKEKELINVNKEINYYKCLDKTFGAKGLQAKIIQEAQEKIKLNANNTLARLSGGRWQIDLQENKDQTQLFIVARDLSQSSTPEQQFEYLSSGEKFIVAISLAVAIGQSIYGGRTVDSLVIDEGFGSLDDDKRPLMVNELKRLSEDILQGGRVIVVSHQNDVCERFDSRYHVYRDENHHAQVEQYLSVPL